MTIDTPARPLWRLHVAVTYSLIIAATVFGLSLSAVSQPANAMNVQQIKSPGGIEAWLVEEKSVPLIALRFAFTGGSSQDPEGKTGVSNFITAMMDEGAGDLTSEEFQDRMESIAMKMRFEDSKDALYGSFETLSANKDEAFHLLKLAISKPRFDADAVERMRQQLSANLVYGDRDPEQVASKAWFAQAYPGHPYALPSEGYVATIAKISRDDLADFHKRTFARSNLKVVAVGDITAAELGKMLDDVFGDLPAEATLTPVAKVDPVAKASQQVVSMPVPQSVAVFGLGAMARKDPDFLTAFVINHILGGGGFSAKLMEEVREKRGLAYSVYSYLQPYDHTSVLLGSVATKNEAMAESLKIIRDELGKMAKSGPTAEELQAAKDYLTGSYALRFDTNSKIATQLLGLRMEGYTPDYIVERNSLIEAITLDDIKRVSKSLLDPGKLIVTIVGQPVGLVSDGAAPVPAAAAGANPG